MQLNEHQSKLLFQEAGIPVPSGDLITPETLNDFAPSGSGPWFCKAQVLTGGRGKAGGIQRADSAADIRPLCERIFAMDIKGHSVPLIRIEGGTSIDREFYLSFVVSRDRRALVFTVSNVGGMEVEEQGKDALLIQNIDALKGVMPNQLRAAFFHLGLGREYFKGFAELVTKLHRAVMDYGLLTCEINPLVTTKDGGWIALDGKVEIDDNFRDLHDDVERFYQPEHASAEENIAREAGLSYVDLNGWVGLMANGAGLAMATMDLLNFAELPAANFMDLGGAADEKRMATALDLLFANADVNVIFINLFGGILSCESVARAMRSVLGSDAPEKPIVVRMAGNGSEAGRAILKELNQPAIHIAEEMNEALDALRSLKPAEAPEITFPRGPHGRDPEVELPSRDRAVRPPDASAPLGLGKGSKVLVQGITGKQAQKHVKLMLEYGTEIVAGVTPFKGGTETLGIPVYNSVQEAMREHHIDASIIFVPGSFAADAVLEAAACEIPWCVCITEGITQHDMLAAQAVCRASRLHRTRLVGPNTPGVIVPGGTKIGIMPGDVFSEGPVAVFSRSGTLTYEAADRLSRAGIGQSVCVGIGGDPFIGVNFVDLLDMVRDDDNTKAVMILGEIGGRAEEDFAQYVRDTGFDKPVLAFIGGQTAPPGKRLGHAGAILEESSGTVESKLNAMREAGFILCPDLQSIPDLAREALEGK